MQFCGITFCPCAQGLISSMSPNGFTCVERRGNKEVYRGSVIWTDDKTRCCVSAVQGGFPVGWWSSLNFITCISFLPPPSFNRDLLLKVRERSSPMSENKDAALI